MKHSIFLILCVVNFSVLFAQDKTYSHSRNMNHQAQKTVFVAPFDDNMFLSDINKEIHNRTGLTQEEIIQTFRDGLIQTLVEMGADYHNFIDPNELDQEEQYEILGKIYSNLSYDYVEVVEMKEVKDAGLLERLKTSSEKEQDGRGSFLENGEIKSWYDGNERFMQARFRSEDDLKDLMVSHELDYLLVITELDIKVMRDIDRDVGQTWPRRVKVHFTIFDQDGKAKFGSAAYDYFEGEEKDIYTIIRKSFDYPSAQIISKISEFNEASSMNETPETPVSNNEKKKINFGLFKDKKESNNDSN